MLLRSLTENPEDEADLNFSDQLVDGSERFFEKKLDFFSSYLFVVVDRRAEYVRGRPVGRHGARLALKPERGQS